MSALVTEPKEDHWLTAGRLAPASARRHTKDFLAAYGLTALQDDGAYVVSELVNNAVEHGSWFGGHVLLALRAPDRAELHISVRDYKPGPLLRSRGVTLNGESGRGLQIVSALSYSWGVADHGDDGKTVWAIIKTTEGSG
jgi:anti-sigma regulatory factor (Ser/Thr protein kinase)